MPKRSEMYAKFGPLLTEALFLLVLENINILRAKAALPPFTEDQAITALENKLNTLKPYEWMSEAP